MSQFRNYDPDECSVFRFTKDEFGIFSNFAPPGVMVNTAAGEVMIPTTEHLYNMLKTDDPRAHERILVAETPKEAKNRAGASSGVKLRSNWEAGLRVTAMKFVTALKFAQNRDDFLPVFDKTGLRPIVEYSQRDDFWGAKPQGNGRLVGVNALGRIYMGIRAETLIRPDARWTSHRVIDAPWEGATLLGSPILPWHRPTVSLNAKVVGKDVPGAVYVGRPSPFGNPTPVSTEKPRGVAIMDFVDHLLENPQLVDKIQKELKGKDLICWCAPGDCHADIIRYVAEGNPPPTEWILRNPPKEKPEDRQMSMDF